MTPPVTIAEAEAMLAQEGPVPSLSSILATLPGQYACNGRCGATVERPGACDACAEARARRLHDAALRPALDSIPERFRWATVDAREEMAARVAYIQRDPAALGRLPDLLRSRVVVFVAPSGAGKTTLACALLRTAIDRGRHDAMRTTLEPTQDARSAPRRVLDAASEVAHALARGARFFAARDLGGGEKLGREDLPASVHAARASLLVVDDVGQEAGTGDTYRGSDRARAIADLLSERHDRGAQTIVTTYGRQAEWANWYGDGVARRYFAGGDGVRVVDLGRVAKVAA